MVAGNCEVHHFGWSIVDLGVLREVGEEEVLRDTFLNASSIQYGEEELCNSQTARLFLDSKTNSIM